jgi:hypothetical protein
LELKIIELSASRILVVGEDGMALGTVLGILTIILFPIPSGIRTWIEDVVVARLAGEMALLNP